MRAPCDVQLQTFDWPTVEPGAVLMRVIYSGICGTDKHTYRGETMQYAGTPHERRIQYPLICGHENVGVVVEVGGDVRDSEGIPLQPGDRIVPAANVPCGTCAACANAYPYYLCQRLEDYGNSLHCGIEPGLFGGWAEYMYLLPRTPLFRVPADLPSEVAVLAEPMSVTHGLDTARAVLATTGGLRFAENVVVIGVGPLGLCHLIKARSTGYAGIVAIDRFPSRLAMAQAFGASLSLNVDETTEADRASAIEAHLGRAPDVVVDCSGVPQTFTESLHLVRPGGVVVEAGAFVDMGGVCINPNADICTKNVCVLGIGGELATAYLPSMRLLASNLNPLPLREVVTHRMPLERATEALEIAQSGQAMKVVFAPHGDEG
jgi:L-iditol 2-dehydrogenase